MKIFWMFIIMSSVFVTNDGFSQNSMDGSQPIVLIMTGPPGSGKGTHAAPLSQELGLPHISTGDLFRENMRQKTSLGIQVQSFIDQGNLVPDQLVIDMLFDRVSKKDCLEGYILDGFPRTIAQAKALDQRLGENAQVMVLSFQLEDEIIIKRIAGRLSCKGCNKNYHKSFDPPQISGICDDCGHNLYQRDDDKEEVIRQRLKVYRAETQPLIEYYAKQTGVLRHIDSNQNKAQVFENCLSAVSAVTVK